MTKFYFKQSYQTLTLLTPTAPCIPTQKPFPFPVPSPYPDLTEYTYRHH